METVDLAVLLTVFGSFMSGAAAGMLLAEGHLRVRVRAHEELIAAQKVLIAAQNDRIHADKARIANLHKENQWLRARLAELRAETPDLSPVKSSIPPIAPDPVTQG